MTANRAFGLLILLFGAALLWFISGGVLSTAPLILIFAGAGGLGAVLLGAWIALGRL